ncbi:DUF1097 domain-containing protein [Edwardsiella anguillarum]|uniref:DUF1097 domain-containing protein n=1 Tax=Edwardsiella anguillarum TaxID=1821960 RepID=UPI0024B7676A|nr:DUF1097 domain-containing protein [Edwardsiella anguillarum]WHP79234.1 DUF1097 domain-containing protein [Edwardsiella anguillarum]WHQ16692.1 DUF1097 domain-containing protein [Edwardsiella anguillarum]WHQ20227.1 DUF1097 domain-containing protein [Edwardsiella anguillarum]WHQ23749.1 DUF1097 domain-containing protein [Edwardsiella anguillarum]WHQ27319.1 DUF1097 domain-containing protein [Edwardsiella anguillarum]
MPVLLAIALTTGILSAVWGWVAISLGLSVWAGFLGCTAYFACPQGGLKGLGISLCTLCSGVFWAEIIINGSALQPHMALLGYGLTGAVAFLMCVQACQRWLSFVPGTFIGCCATFAAGGDWRLVIPSLLLGLLFGYGMKNSGLWLAARRRRSVPLPDDARTDGAGGR